MFLRSAFLHRPSGSLPVAILLASLTGLVSVAFARNISAQAVSGSTRQVAPRSNAFATMPLANSSVPGYVVTTSADDANGLPENCTDQSVSDATPDPSCSLRDALAASETGGGNITFDTTVFASSQSAQARTISLTNGTLTVPSHTTITGPTTGSGSSLANLVTLAGYTPGYPVLTVNLGVVNTAISNLTITGSQMFGPGAGLYNDGALTLTNVSIQGMRVSITFVYGGGGIVNDPAGVLTLTNCLISNNIDDTDGGGIYNNGTLTITDSIISGNEIEYFGGSAGIANYGTMTITSSTITENLLFQGEAGGIGNAGAMTVTNSVVADNLTNYGQPDSLDNPPIEDDCYGPGCPSDETNGNVVGAGRSSTTPGSPAICAGLLADVPQGLTTDQRGLPRTTVYSMSSGNVTCVDAGAIQTNYLLNFSQQPPATVAPNSDFAAAVQLSESGSPFQVAGIAIPLALGAGDNGTLSGNTASTAANGVASFTQLKISASGTGHTLVASLPLTSSPPPAPLTSPIDISATSSSFNVTETSQTITFPALATPVTYGVAPIVLAATASSGLPITYSVTGPATGSGSTLTITGAGRVVVTASQVGNANYLAAPQLTQTIVVDKATATVTLTNLIQTYTGSPESATATTNPAGLNIGLTYDNNPTPPTAVGSYTVVGTINDADYTGTATGILKINPASVTLALSTMPGNPVYGTALQLTGKVTPALAGLAASTFSFLFDQGTPNAVMIPAALYANGTVTATYGRLTTGQHTAVMIFAGTPDYATMKSPPLALAVSQAASAISLNSSNANIDLNASVTFTAMVTSTTTGAPGGSVQFLDGTTALVNAAINAQGTAAYATTALTAGVHTISAIYAGDQNFAGSQAMLTQQVTAPAITITPSAYSLTLNQGQAGDLKLTFIPAGGLTGTMHFACSGLPPFATCDFNPAAVTVDGSNTPVVSTLTIGTLGPDHGMMSQLHRETVPTKSALPAAISLVPGVLAGIILCWRRKPMKRADKHLLFILTLFAAGGMMSCGSGRVTPVGNSLVTITATGENHVSQSTSIVLTVAK